MAGHKSISEWEALFKEADTNKSGSLDYNELKALLKKGNSNLTDSQIKEVFDYFDEDGSKGQITLKEFEDGLCRVEDFIKELHTLFKKFDTDNSNYLDKKELVKLISSCGHNFTEDEITLIMRDADKSGDGKICFEEFINAFT